MALLKELMEEDDEEKFGSDLEKEKELEDVEDGSDHESDTHRNSSCDFINGDGTVGVEEILAEICLDEFPHKVLAGGGKVAGGSINGSEGASNFNVAEAEEEEEASQSDLLAESEGEDFLILNK